MGWLQRALMAAAAAGLLGGLGWLVLAPAVLTVETARVARGRFVATVDQEGRTRVRDRYVVAAPLSGRMERIAVREGDRVEAGQPVAVLLPSLPALLDPRTRAELGARVAAAQAALAISDALARRAVAEARQFRVEAERQQVLLQRGAASAQTAERATLAAETAERAQVAAEERRHAAEHELEQIRTLLQHFEAHETGPERWEIRAPVTGRVLRVLQRSEAPVEKGAALVEIGDPGELEAIADVLTGEAVAIAPGAAASIEAWGGAPLAARVRLVEPAAFTRVSALGVEEQRVWVVMDIVAPRAAWEALGDGFRIEARITVAELPDAVLVPVAALFRRHEGWAVFVVQDGRARLRPVEIARRGAPLAAVAAGLQPDEAVVVYPPAALAEGARVVAR